MTLPQDPYILLSWVNTQLRDNYASLNDLYDDLGLEAGTIEARLAEAGFEYNGAQNKFW